MKTPSEAEEVDSDGGDYAMANKIDTPLADNVFYCVEVIYDCDTELNRLSKLDQKCLIGNKSL